MKISLKETALFAIISALMFASKVIMEFLPNIHLLATFIIATTVVYRAKALYPIYTYVFINGLVVGFATWWVPYLYIWTVLWGAIMILPRNIPTKLKPIVYMILAALHGFLFGTLYSPMQALFFGLDFKGTIAWIIAGLPFDFIHGVSNFFCGLLIYPIILILKNAQKYTTKN